MAFDRFDIQSEQLLNKNSFVLDFHTTSFNYLVFKSSDGIDALIFRGAVYLRSPLFLQDIRLSILSDSDNLSNFPKEFYIVNSNNKLYRLADDYQNNVVVAEKALYLSRTIEEALTPVNLMDKRIKAFR